MMVRPMNDLAVSYAPKYKADDGMAPKIAVPNPTYTVRCCIKYRKASWTDNIVVGRDGGGGTVRVAAAAVAEDAMWA